MPTKRTQVNRLYNEKNYDRISVTVPKGSKKMIENHAKNKGMSVNGLINCLLWADIGTDHDEVIKIYREEVHHEHETK